MHDFNLNLGNRNGKEGKERNTEGGKGSKKKKG